MAPLLDAAVSAQGLRADRDALVRLAARSMESAGASRAASGALATLMDVAASEGAELAIFKGFAIASRWYPSPELRPAVDIDAFVDPAQTTRLGHIAARVAHRPEAREVVEAMVAEGRVFEYPLSVEGVTVDLHLDPMNMVVASRQQDVIWDSTEVIRVSPDREVRVLNLEHSIIQALLHAFRDNFADLLHVYDIRLMMDAKPDWDFVEDFSDGEGWTDIVRHSLGFVCDLLQRPSPIPRAVSRTSSLMLQALWPSRIRLRGIESLARSDRRQSLASYLITGRRAEVTRAMARRVLPPRSVIDDRCPQCSGRYPFALYQWRRTQRAEITRFRRLARTRSDAPPDERKPHAKV